MMALPIAGVHAVDYMVTFVTDRPGGFTANEIDDLARVGERLAVVIDRHSQWWITRNVLSAYLGARTGPKVLAGQIRRDWRDQQHHIADGHTPQRSAPPATPARVAFVRLISRPSEPPTP